jgi:hypothetical protein
MNGKMFFSAGNFRFSCSGVSQPTCLDEFGGKSFDNFLVRH